MSAGSTFCGQQVAAIRQRAPIIAAGSLARNGAKHPHPFDFDLFEKVYSGHTSILNLFSWMDNIWDTIARSSLESAAARKLAFYH